MFLRAAYMYSSNQETSNGSKSSIVIFDSTASFSKTRTVNSQLPTLETLQVAFAYPVRTLKPYLDEKAQAKYEHRLRITLCVDHVLSPQATVQSAKNPVSRTLITKVSRVSLGEISQV